MIKEKLKAKFEQFINLTDEEFETVYNYMSFKTLKRREVLLEIGTVCNHTYFIGEGLIRYYHDVDGEEVTGQFFFEGGWYIDFESFISGDPSRQGVQALEKTELAVLSKKDIYKLYVEVPKMERFGRIMAENAFIGLRKKTDAFTLRTPEERYLDLIKQRPKVISRVPQHYIASYLGVKPQSLSRIRKRISKKLIS